MVTFLKKIFLISVFSLVSPISLVKMLLDLNRRGSTIMTVAAFHGPGAVLDNGYIIYPRARCHHLILQMKEQGVRY